MATSVATAERAVQSAFADAFRHTKYRASLFETEAALWTSLPALGRAMITLYLLRAAARPRATSYRKKGQLYVLDTKHPRRTQLGTRFGKVSFARPVGRRLGAPRSCPMAWVARSNRLWAPQPPVSPGTPTAI